MFKSLALALTLVSGVSAQFEFGSLCEAGSGTFVQTVCKDATLVVPGNIVSSKYNVAISLVSSKDVDVQLYDVETNTKLVGYDGGIVDSATRAMGSFGTGDTRVVFDYSGYDGEGGNAGNEYIRIRGGTNRELRMEVFGYIPGGGCVDFTVNFQFEGKPGCIEKGKQSFEVTGLAKGDVSVLGTLKAGLSNIRINLRATGDLDVLLIEEGSNNENDRIVVSFDKGSVKGQKAKCGGHWPPSGGSFRVCYSGYDGDGTGKGNEYIVIDGTLPVDLEMRIESFADVGQIVDAKVIYAWGLGDDALINTQDIVFEEYSSVDAGLQAAELLKRELYKENAENKLVLTPRVEDLFTASPILRSLSKAGIRCQALDRDNVPGLTWSTLTLCLEASLDKIGRHCSNDIVFSAVGARFHKVEDRARASTVEIEVEGVVTSCFDSREDAHTVTISIDVPSVDFPALQAALSARGDDETTIVFEKLVSAHVRLEALAFEDNTSQ